ncbi:MAG: fatty acid desaturase [Cyanobacteria bacterium P01_C01_bin.118]
MHSKTRLSLQDQPAWIQTGIQLGNHFHYRRKQPVVHNGLNLSVLFLILMGLACLFYLGTILPVSVFIPLGAIGFGLLYFMLFILVVHEASHGMFIILRNIRQAQTWNRCLGWAVCIPFHRDFIKHWELGHRIHHCYPVEAHDPQNCPETVYTGSRLFKHIAKVLLIPGYAILGINSVCTAEQTYRKNWRLSISSIAIWGLSTVVETIYLGWQVPVAALLGIQILVILNTLKIAIEHGGDIGQRENHFLRSCSSFFPLRFLLMPLNISLHFEHHLNCAVPWYDLMSYHRKLSAVIPADLHSDVFKTNELWKQINA